MCKANREIPSVWQKTFSRKINGSALAEHHAKLRGYLSS